MKQEYEKGYKTLRFSEENGYPITLGTSTKPKAAEKRAAKIAAKQGLEYFGRRHITGL